MNGRDGQLFRMSDVHAQDMERRAYFDAFNTPDPDDDEYANWLIAKAIAEREEDFEGIIPQLNNQTKNDNGTNSRTNSDTGIQDHLNGVTHGEVHPSDRLGDAAF